MGFEYDETTHSAIDRENDIRIRMSSRFFDTDDLNYEYKDDQIEFVFGVFECSAMRTHIFRGEPMQSRTGVALYIVEQSVRMGLQMRISGDPIKPERYPEIRRAIQDGMYVLGTRGGKVLSTVPDYKVEYIPDYSNVPNLRL
ncbi:hypothetical protein [Ralstonia sp.]|uniref:hypothetical protein n=1 Tax=Ralstonia sp. TaxID=54061 RepID=UPI0031DD051C